MSSKDPKRKVEAAKASPAFPGGKVVTAPGELRIAVDRIPYAQIIGHAILEPDVEVGGVLVGGVGEDEHGPFVHVRHAIRAEGAHQENAAVTFTHETWNHIHQEMDSRYPDEQIVGWYHTHGGFGVFLSEMDTFVHQNFFPEPHHLAYVYDPLAGSEGFFLRKGEKLEPAERYWLGGRERRPAMRMPEPEPRSREPAGGDARVVEVIRKVAAAVQWSAGERRAAEGSWTQYLPWAVALACVALLLLGPRGPATAEPGTRSGGLVVSFEPGTMKAVTIPLRSTDEIFGPGTWVLPVDLELPAADGTVAARLPGVATLNAILAARAAEVAQQSEDRAATRGVLVRWGLVAAAVLAALAVLGAAAWWFFLRRS
jgi:proteasome lid subunit RPN8/RPN11